jgi:hypothetical protein
MDDLMEIYESARIEVQLFQKGAAVTGKSWIQTYLHPPNNIAWYPYDQFPQMASIGDDTVTFLQDAALVQVTAIGDARDAFATGEIAFLLVTHKLQEVFGDHLKRFVDRARQEPEWNNGYSVSAFVAVFTMDNMAAGPLRYEGLLPMDTRLLHIVQELPL